ncbi:MAG: hypothetical protein Q8P32_03910 [Candidatus Komeilibacteria bacterium]|nr:hypothetical protein [Candidatus Komeilibacteria bacterium]
MKEGLFIVIYGINNLGKSTQAELLVESLEKAGLKAQYLKYPIYDLTPTGPLINEVLRGAGGQKMSEEELQAIYTQNRRDYQPQLIKLIDEGVNVVAEDYVGTGLAWGWSKGADLEKLIESNRGLLKPDIEILLDGERFIQAKEEGHLHESNDALVEKCRANHLQLAARFGWAVVNANQEIDEVQDEILKVIAEKIKSLK